MKTIAEVLRKRIRELGFEDIKECARKFDVPYELLRKVISDGHLPKDKTLLFYAEQFGLNAAELITTVYRQRAPAHLQHLFEGAGAISERRAASGSSRIRLNRTLSSRWTSPTRTPFSSRRRERA
jgi:hypothetical protein